MGRAARTYTPAEAAVVSGIALKTINNALDKRIIEARRTHGRRALTGEDVLLLKVWHGIGSALAADGRRALFDAIRAKPGAPTVRADDLLIVDLAAARRQIKARVKDLEEAEADIHSVEDIMSGNPVFKGTRMPVHDVASMIRDGASEDELLEYPSLTKRRLELAVIWADAHPPRGRPKTLVEYGARVISVTHVSLSALPAIGEDGRPA